MIKTLILNKPCERIIPPSLTPVIHYNPFTWEIVIHHTSRCGLTDAAMIVIDVLSMAENHGLCHCYWEVSRHSFVVDYPLIEVREWLRKVAFVRGLAIDIYCPYNGEYYCKWDGAWSR